jgi:large subunit ribosomal protein L13e
MVKHNNVIPNGHFKKKWQFRVRTWFNQPARKLRRRQGERRSWGPGVWGRSRDLAPRPSPSTCPDALRAHLAPHSPR